MNRSQRRRGGSRHPYNKHARPLRMDRRGPGGLILLTTSLAAFQTPPFNSTVLSFAVPTLGGREFHASLYSLVLVPIAYPVPLPPAHDSAGGAAGRHPRQDKGIQGRLRSDDGRVADRGGGHRPPHANRCLAGDGGASAQRYCRPPPPP